jgi:glycosyltransferase involved in cell wall biosynthesis
LKQVVVVHDSLNFCGGAEKLSLETMRSLASLGYMISLRTIERTDWARVRRIFGAVAKPQNERFLVDALPAPRTYRSLLSVFTKRGPKGSIVLNTNGDVIPGTFDDFTYVHFPRPLEFVVRDPELDNVGPAWDLYFAPSRLIRKSLDAIGSDSTLLTNSSFSRDKIRQHWGRKAIVLYPPVDVETYGALLDSNPDREDVVVVISRFDAVKNLEIVPWVAANCKSAKEFVVIGSAGPKDGPVIDRLTENARKLGVKEKIRIVPNATNLQKHQYLARAKVLFHPKRYEHFGISIIEGMAAGCTPVVFDGGGPAELVDREYRGVRTEEFPLLIDKALGSWSRARAHGLFEASKKFNRENYQSRLQQILSYRW